MSREGYYECLCPEGHKTEIDWEDFLVCGFTSCQCGKEFIFTNEVDTTNHAGITFPFKIKEHNEKALIFFIPTPEEIIEFKILKEKEEEKFFEEYNKLQEELYADDT